MSLLAKKSPAQVKASDWTGDGGLRTGPLVRTLPPDVSESPGRRGGRKGEGSVLRHQGLFLPGNGLLWEK